MSARLACCSRSTTESGFKDVVFITGQLRPGETVGRGAVNPDEFYVHKPALEAGKWPVIRRAWARS
jgi:pyruvate,water dikinase